MWQNGTFSVFYCINSTQRTPSLEPRLVKDTLYMLWIAWLPRMVEHVCIRVCTDPRLVFSTNQRATVYSRRCCLLLAAIFPSQATSWQRLFTNYHDTFKRMVRRIAWGICNVNSQYLECMQWIRFYQCSNPKTKLGKCFTLD